VAPSAAPDQWQERQHSIQTCHVRPTVLIVAISGIADGSLGATLDVLGAAERLRRAGFAAGTRPACTVRVVSPRGRSVRSASGRLVPVDGTTEGATSLRRGDVVILPGLGMATEDDVETTLARRDIQDVLAFLRRAAAAGATLAASCSSTFVLAESGLLDGKSATTTWWLAPLFSRRYPRVELRADRMVVALRDRITAGSAFSQVDLMLAVVARLFGPALAHLAARYLVVDERPSQARYVVVEHIGRDDPAIQALERFVTANLARPLTLQELARATGASPRTLARRVAGSLSLTPMGFVRRLRAQHAAHLLATTGLSLERVAERVGYAEPGALRRVLRLELDASPRQLRRPR
jgi:transcriptional regulator GlxA family with amidase domain